MIPLLPNLVEALRTELTQYGEMLALLETQQALVTRHGTDAVLDSITAITGQGQAIEAARQQRLCWQRDLAATLSLPGHATFTQLLPRLPDDYRPLVGALVQENNELLQRVRDCARQNHRLMRHSLELMQRFIIMLSPSDVSDLPGGDEPPLDAVPPGPSLYAAIV